MMTHLLKTSWRNVFLRYQTMANSMLHLTLKMYLTNGAKVVKKIIIKNGIRI